LKEAALYRILRRTRFGRGYGPVVRQTAEWMNEFQCTSQQPMSVARKYNRVCKVCVSKFCFAGICGSPCRAEAPPPPLGRASALTRKLLSPNNFPYLHLASSSILTFPLVFSS
jgi:hypothetical protein